MALTSNGSVTNSGGAVGSLALTFDNALTEGDFYLFQCDVITTSAGGTLNLYINSDTTDANYDAGFIESDGTQSTGNRTVRATPDAAGNITVIKGACGLLNGEPWITAQVVDEGATERASTYGVTNSSESTFTGFTLSASASIIANDTTIKCWPVSDLTTVADVTVSGGAVTTLDTGAFTALSEGKQYLLFGAKIRNGTGSSNSFYYMNGDTTAANYRRGFVSATSTGDDSNTAPVIAAAADGRIGVSFGFVGILNSTPYLSHIHVYQQAPTYAAQVVSVYHPTETNFDQLQITCGDASGLDNGTRILIKEFSA